MSSTFPRHDARREAALSFRADRIAPWIVSVVAGVGGGVALHNLLPPPSTSYSSTPAFTGCRPKGDNCHCDGDRLPLGEHRDPLGRGRELLAGYAASLCDLADAVDGFRKAPVANREQLRHAARPLISPINRVNDTARELQWARMPLTLDVLSRASDEPSQAEALACSLKSANRYQVETFRNNLNAAMVNVQAAWQGNGDATTFENIRRQQASEWPKLALILRRGCAQFGQTNVSESPE